MIISQELRVVILIILGLLLVHTLLKAYFGMCRPGRRKR
jgi:hypothetical protein